MNVSVSLTVGNVVVEASAEDCGPDACGDLFHQATLYMLTLVDREACMAATKARWSGEDDDD